MKDYSSIMEYGGAIESDFFEMLSNLVHSDEEIIKVSSDGNSDFLVKDACVWGTSFFAMLSELLCSSGGIIKIPERADYTLEDVISTITYAATSTANSIEAATSELRQKNTR